MRAIRLLNTALVIACLVLLANLFYPLDSLTGNLAYQLHPSPPHCFFSHPDGTQKEINDLSLCCSQIEKQLVCQETEEGSVECYNVKGSWSYELNSKAFNYCVKEGYRVKE